MLIIWLTPPLILPWQSFSYCFPDPARLAWVDLDFCVWSTIQHWLISKSQTAQARSSAEQRRVRKKRGMGWGVAAFWNVNAQEITRNWLTGIVFLSAFVGAGFQISASLQSSVACLCPQLLAATLYTLDQKAGKESTGICSLVFITDGQCKRSNAFCVLVFPLQWIVFVLFLCLIIIKLTSVAN
jgi:hypothetical protein